MEFGLNRINGWVLLTLERQDKWVWHPFCHELLLDQAGMTASE